jgi:hypothetical protein
MRNSYSVIWKLFCVTVGAKDGAVRLVSPYVQARIEYAQQVSLFCFDDLWIRLKLDLRVL